MGCDEVGLGDTLGVGTPKLTQELLELLLKDVPAEKLTGHFHDTYGQAVANVMRSYEMGLRTFDTSVAGLGGCPYAPGAKGNAASEDIINTLENSKIETGVDLAKLSAVGEWISQQLGIPNNSRAGAALMAKKRQTQRSPKAEPSSSETTAKSSPPQGARAASRTWIVSKQADGYALSRSGSAVKTPCVTEKWQRRDDRDA